jgi:transposase
MKSREIPTDLASCQNVLREELARNEQLASITAEQAEKLDAQQQQINQLRHELELFRRYVYGQRRERFTEDPCQQKLFEIDRSILAEAATDEEEPESPAKPTRRRGHGRRRLPEFLPRVDEVHELSPEELPCPCCGTVRHRVSQVVSEQLELVPAKLFVIRHVRYVYACVDETCQPNMVTASKPPQPIEKGLPGPGLLAFVAASKLADHLPLNRQEDILTRSGVHVARSTQCDWMASCARLVRPLYELMVARVLQSKVLGTDDTTVPLRDPQLDHTRTAYFWAYLGDKDHPYTCYDFTTRHTRDGPQKFLKGFEGYLQGDAYSGYIQLAQLSNGKIQHAGCWAHVRRYYDRADTTESPNPACEALAYIRRLYDVDHQTKGMSGADRQRVRQEYSVPILQEFRQWLERQQANVLPSSPLGDAFTYTLNQWDSLCLFIRDGDIPLDNNRTEHTVRQQVIGRANWLFAGSEQGGETAAILYSLVASCKRLRIDPFAYMRDVFAILPGSSSDDTLESLLPDRWIQRHPEHRLTHREKEASQAEQRRRERRSRRRKLNKARSE